MTDSMKKEQFFQTLSRLERRDFLRIGGYGAAAILVAGCGARLTQGTISGGSVSDLAQGSARAVEGEPLIIVRDEGGLYALTAVCTHFGCTVDIQGEQLTCACHGSAFDLDGAVLSGPARTPLQHFRVVLENGAISVDTTAPVPPETRTPVDA
jgi:cytochrome b6-f complex iron-sulfur subunit